MNIRVFVSFLVLMLTLLAPVLAGDKDDGTIIIGESGQILYKGGKKVSLKQLIESLQITLTIDTYVRTTIRSSSREGDEDPSSRLTHRVREPPLGLPLPSMTHLSRE